jgi:predicted negative regulator of RcsB-dependent stress response
MDRRTRKELKTDKFAQEVGHTVQYLAGHKKQVKLYGAIGLVVLIAAAGYWTYSGRQAAARAKALADAIRVADAVISAAPQPPLLNFATQEEKDKAVLRAYTKVAADYPGTQEGAIAQLYVAAAKNDKGEAEEAIKLYRQAADSAPKEYRRVAQLALGELLAGQNQNEEAEKILKALSEEDSSALVSQEEALLAYGRVLARRDPAEARKILEPLRDVPRVAVSSAAVTAIAALPPVTKTAEPAPKSN